MKWIGFLWTAVAVVLMSGCTAISWAPDEAHEVAAALANYERLATLKSEEQRREFNAAQAAYDRTANDTTRINLALAMMLPRASWRDDARIQSLLGGVEASPDKQPSARYDFAQLLLKLLSERQRAQREERRKTEEMQQKIESLRAIDREMGMRRKAP